MKNLLKKIIRIIAKFLPIRLIIFFVQKILFFKLSSMKPNDSLKSLMEFDNFIYQLSGQLAVEYGDGIHVKKRLTKYVEFFALLAQRHGGPCLDIGCGDGELCKMIAQKKIRVTGIDHSLNAIKKAKKGESNHYSEFIHGDFNKIKIKKKFRTIILSNVIEHVDDRVNFIKRVNKDYSPKYFLIRVPSFERDWRVPLKKELNVDYRLDSTHFIEYTEEILVDELKKSNLKILQLKKVWGEIWLSAKTI